MSSAEATLYASVAFVAGLTLLVGWIAWLVARVERSRQRAELDARLEVVRRLGEADGVRAFLESADARRLLGGDPLERARDRALRAVGRGVVALFVGAALWGVGAVASVEEAEAAGFLLAGGGLGLLAAAAVTRYLSLRWRPEGDR